MFFAGKSKASAFTIDSAKNALLKHLSIPDMSFKFEKFLQISEFMFPPIVKTGSLSI